MKRFFFFGVLAAATAALSAAIGCSSGPTESSRSAPSGLDQTACEPAFCPPGVCTTTTDSCGNRQICLGCADGAALCEDGPDAAFVPCCQPIRHCPAHFCGVLDDGCGGQLCCTAGGKSAAYCCTSE
jgi:hypothetical protein